jgi:hypothetical protein
MQGKIQQIRQMVKNISGSKLDYYESFGELANAFA